MARFSAAADLLKAGFADRILVNLEEQSRADRKWQARYGDTFSARRVIAHMMAVDGVPEEDVIISTKRAVSTEQDFAILREYLTSGNIRSVIVVTSGSHLRRCRLVADRMIGDQVSICFAAADTPDQDRYISRPKRALDLFVAYLKLGYYYLWVF
jgi:uncharacterized SAM-binding protein YcdF (DUF218 family)